MYSILNDLLEQISEDELIQLTDDGIHVEDAVFNGAGIDDLSSGGTFTGASNLSFMIEIDAEGTPDTFKWSKDGGLTWEASGVAITGATQSLIEGVTIDFIATTGHTLGDKWTFDAFPENTIDTSVTDRAIADADAEIDSYCGIQYDVPFSAPAPAMVRKLSVDIAIYNLYSRRGDVIPDERKERYNSALRFLRDVAKGIISLGADSPAPDDEGGPKATTIKSDRIFSRGRISDGSSGSLDNY